MKNTTIFFNLTNSLISLFLLISLPFSYSQQLALAKNAFCEDVDLKTCLKEQIESANYVVEGQVIQSEKYLDAKGEWRFKTVLSVEKVFKGEFGADTILVDYSEDQLKEFILLFLKENFRKEDMNIVPTKTGGVGVFIFNNGIIRDNRFEIERLFSYIDLSYIRNYDIYRYLPTEKQDYICYTRRGKDELAFERAEDVYEFILSCSGTKFEDITFRKFEKPSREEWLKKKAKNKK